MKFLKTYTTLFFALVLALTFVFPAAAAQTSPFKEHTTGDTGAWVKQGDTWVYEMDIAPGTWYYWEEEINGYTSDVEEGAKIGQNDREIVVTNTQDLDYGSLALSKAVSGTAEGEPGFVSAFEFALTLEGEHISGIQMFGDYTFYNGVTHVKLADGESIKLDKIPAGTVYTIAEEYLPHYNATITTTDKISGGAATTTDNENRTASGTIDKDGEDSIHYTNTYTTPAEIVETNSFKISKTISGNAEIKDREFTLKLALEGLEADKEYQIIRSGVETPDTFTSDRDGNADVTVMIRDGETLTVGATKKIQDGETQIVNTLPVGAAYRITELGGDYVSSYQITDAKGKNEIHTSAGTSDIKEMPLSTGKEVVDKDEDITVAFTNEFFKVQELHLTKRLTDVDGNKLEPTPEKFRFVIEFDKVPSSGFESSVGFITAEDGYASVDVLLSAGETIDFFDVPVGTTWQIKEVGNDYLPSYGLTAKGTGDFVLQNGHNDEPRKDLSTALETVNEGEDTTVTFTNQKPAQDPKNLTLKKLVAGNFGDKTKSFPFTITLTDKDGNPLSGTFQCEGKVNQLRLNEKGQAMVSLSHEESVTIKGVPANAKYTICETNSDGYTVSPAEESETSKTELKAKNGLTGSIKEIQGEMNSQNHTVTFTNTMTFPVPTGVLLSVAPYVFIGGAILAFLVVRVMMRKKQK